MVFFLASLLKRTNVFLKCVSFFFILACVLALLTRAKQEASVNKSIKKTITTQKTCKESVGYPSNLRL